MTPPPQAGLSPVKVNMVVKRAVNDRAIVPMAEYFRNSGHILRFIEYMDVGTTNGWRLDDVVPAAEIRGAIDDRWPLAPLPANYRGEVADRYGYRDGAGEIGLIASVTQPFCGGCSRARLSAEGKLRTCLFASHGHDLRAILRSGATDHELSIWKARADGYSETRTADTAPTSPSMSVLPARRSRPTIRSLRDDLGIELPTVDVDLGVTEHPLMDEARRVAPAAPCGQKRIPAIDHPLVYRLRHGRWLGATWLEDEAGRF